MIGDLGGSCTVDWALKRVSRRAMVGGTEDVQVRVDLLERSELAFDHYSECSGYSTRRRVRMK